MGKQFVHILLFSTHLLTTNKFSYISDQEFGSAKKNILSLLQLNQRPCKVWTFSKKFRKRLFRRQTWRRHKTLNKLTSTCKLLSNICDVEKRPTTRFKNRQTFHRLTAFKTSVKLTDKSHRQRPKIVKCRRKVLLSRFLLLSLAARSRVVFQRASNNRRRRCNNR